MKEASSLVLKKTYSIVLIGLLISMEVVLTRFLSINTSFVRIGLGFLPIAILSMIYGPLLGGAAYALSDFIGVLIAGFAAYNPGLTISAFLTGLAYGLILYKKPKTLLRVFIAVLTIRIIINMGLNSYWLWLMKWFMNVRSGLNMEQFWNPFRYWGLFLVDLIPRVESSLIMIPVQTGLIYYFWRYLGTFIETRIIHAQRFQNINAKTSEENDLTD